MTRFAAAMLCFAILPPLAAAADDSCKTEDSQLNGESNIVIIQGCAAHGFSEITEPLTCMVVRIDSERLVTLR